MSNFWLLRKLPKIKVTLAAFSRNSVGMESELSEEVHESNETEINGGIRDSEIKVYQS